MAIQESKLLDSIGTAQMEQQIQKKVLKIAKEHERTLQEQTGVDLHEWHHSELNKRIYKNMWLKY
jgi:hypothetical protein